MSALLEFRRVSFAWKHRAVLQEASFQLAPGETVALLGPNGAGKTTLLRLAAGMLQPDSGEVLLQGKRVTALNRRERAQKVALVPQRLQVPFAYTVQQIVEQARTPYTGLLGKLSTEDSEAVERAFILTDTAQFRDRVMQELSGGEQQRVKLALGLAQTPDLLLLDEPAQSLDIGWQHNLFATISSLRSEGVAILAAVHELHLVSKFFARSLLLAPGEPLQDARSDVMLASEELHAAFHREWMGPAQNIQEQN